MIFFKFHLNELISVDSEGKLINADKITYNKSREFLMAEGNVEITDIEGNILKADKITY